MSTLLEAITPFSPNIVEAFKSVNRAIFVPACYIHTGAAWMLQSAGALVDEDRALTTQITNGLPSSSSSQPSIMAAMLEALDMRPGMRVLEIGTGTGYNAALLAHLVGKRGRIVSVDIDADLISQARHRLAAAGYRNVELLKANGREAVNTTFDRIIVTAGFRKIESAWMRELDQGGILVGNLLGNMTHVLVRLEKGQGIVLGCLFGSAFFMEIHDGTPHIEAPDWSQYPLAYGEKRASAELLEALKNPAFLFFLQSRIPEAQLHRRAIGSPEQHELCKVFLRGKSTATIRKSGIVEEHGGIWRQIERAYQDYTEHGEPGLEDYQVSVQSDGSIAIREDHINLTGDGARNW